LYDIGRQHVGSTLGRRAARSVVTRIGHVRCPLDWCHDKCRGL
jgi:hypothetical protein